MAERKISILMTSMYEVATIGTALQTFVDGYEGDFEIILSIPDEETRQAALRAAEAGPANNGVKGFADKIQFSPLPMVDNKPKGKPRELNHMMDMATGDIWLFGDGDTWFGKNVINLLLSHFSDPQVMAVTGHPVSADSKDNMMGYFGHLLVDAADHKRRIDLQNEGGYSRTFVKKRPFFPVSGYLFAMRRTDIRAPEDTLVEDAYFSYMIHNNGGKIEYEPEAIVYVKFAKTLKDYFKQKKRSVGGYVQMWNYGIVRPETNTRSFLRELEYFWFPIKYAKNLKQLVWSAALYPIRLWLWIRIFYERRILKKDFSKTWVRIESTK